MKNRIRELRKQAGFTQEVLAPKLGIAQNSLSCWENEVSEPDNATLCKLADIFDCSIDYILCRTNDPSRTSLSINEAIDIGRFNDSLSLISESKDDFYIMYGEKQTDLLKKAAKKGIYFFCADEIVSYGAIKQALEIAESLFPFISPNESKTTKLPESIRGVIKIDEEIEYAVMNDSPKRIAPLHMLPQDASAQEPAKIVAFGGDNTTTEPNENYLERKALRQKIDEEQD